MENQEEKKEETAIEQNPTPKRPLTKEEVLVLELHQVKMENATKDLLLIDNKIANMQRERREAEIKLEKIKADDSNFLRALADQLGVPSLDGWSLNPTNGHLTPRQK